MTSCKEWLNTKTFEYKQAACMFGHSEWIEIPGGAEKATFCRGFIAFWKDGATLFAGDDSEWDFNYNLDCSEYLIMLKDCGAEIIWQRESELWAMANPMKEYLDANRSYEFVLSTEKDDGFIEIPDGMNYAYREGSFIQFTKQEMGYRDSVLVWQRDQDEPFLTPECTLNDQYAKIEKVRQHKHYFKDVSGLDEIDVYMVLKLFNVTDPCLQHIAKKALCAGQRGHKDFKKDLQDILDTAKRAVEINN